MAKKVAKKAKNSVSLSNMADVVSLVSALWFMNSVTNNVYEKVNSDIKDAPASYALIVAVVLIAYLVYKRRKIDSWTSFSIGILVASSFIWLLGLSIGRSFGY